LLDSNNYVQLLFAGMESWQNASAAFNRCGVACFGDGAPEIQVADSMCLGVWRSIQLGIASNAKLMQDPARPNIDESVEFFGLSIALTFRS